MRWCRPKCCLSHGGDSQCKVVVMKGGDSDRDAGGGKRRVVVFVFNYKSDLSLNSKFNMVT